MYQGKVFKTIDPVRAREVREFILTRSNKQGSKASKDLEQFLKMVSKELE